MKLRDDSALDTSIVGKFKPGDRVMRMYGTQVYLDAMPGHVYTCLGYKDKRHILLHEAPPDSGGLLDDKFVLADLEPRKPEGNEYCLGFACLGAYKREHKGAPLICNVCGDNGEERMSRTFKVGNMVRRTAKSHQGSNGLSEKDKVYKVLSADSRHIGIFMHRDRENEVEGACWVASNFELVSSHNDVPTTTEVTDVDEYEIIDVPFNELTPHRRTMVVKGWPWMCHGCNSSAKTEAKARACCSRNRKLNYTEQPDHLWYSSSKDEVVEIEHMMAPHLKAAINKLRKEKERNTMYHLLGVLEAEADRRSLDI